MNHRIDKIFRDSIKHPNFEFQQKDWEAARQLLAEEDVRRKTLLWWFLAGMLILGAVSYWLKPYMTTDPLAEIYVEQVENTQTQLNAQVAPTISDDNTAMGYTTQSEENIIKTSDGKISSNPARIKNRHASKLLKSDIYNRPTEPHHPIGALTFDTHLEKGSTAVRNKKIPDSSSDEDIFINTKQEVHRVGIQIPFVERLPFMLQPSTIQPLDNLITTLGKISPKTNLETPWEMGVYIASTQPNSSWSGGGYVNRSINVHWSIDIGVGIYRYDYDPVNRNEALDVMNQRGITSTSSLSEDIVVKQLSLEMPIFLQYRQQRHMIYGGSILKVPVWTKRSHEAQLGVIELSGIDLATPTSLDPVTFNQSQVLINDPELNNISVFGALGYGYQLNNRIRFLAIGQYRVSSLPQVTSIIVPDVQIEIDNRRWALRATMIWSF